MILVVLARAAQADLRRAVRFYEEQATGLGLEFNSELEYAFALLAENPDLGAPLSRGARELVVRRFPYLVIYRAETERVLVLTIAHQRYHPGVWLART